VKGVAVRGYTSAGLGEGGLNTIYSISLEGMNLCFLGALSSPVLPAAAKQELDDIDILFLPVGGAGLLDHAEAYKLAVQLEPKAIIPMHYTEQSLKAFLKEAGAEGVKPIEKLTVKKKDLNEKEAEVIVLSV
jgi:L-ascorbate metabolism protein UlaG (beta-lactamase superfamily)